MNVASIICPLVDEAELLRKQSCLLCMKFRLRDHATLIVCDEGRNVYLTRMMADDPEGVIAQCRGEAAFCTLYEVDS